MRWVTPADYGAPAHLPGRNISAQQVILPIPAPQSAAADGPGGSRDAGDATRRMLSGQPGMGLPPC